MSNGARRPGQVRGKRDRNKKPPLFRIAVRILVTICISLSISILFNIRNNAQEKLITVVVELLSIFGAFFISVFKRRENANTETAFKEAVTDFLFNPLITVFVGVLCASLLSAIFLPEPINEGGITAQAPDKGAVFPIGTSSSPDPQEECHITLSAWEIDPFFEKKDEYMGYQVTDDDLSDVLFHQLSMTVLLIPVKGPYDSNDLDFSPYGENTKLACQSEEGYYFYCEMEQERGETREDHQIYLLNDANHYRLEADKFYSVSDNQKMLGGNAVLLGDLHSEIDEKFQCYSDAFGYFQNAYRSAISEGRSVNYLNNIVDQMAFVSSKLKNLPMDNWECTSAPHIVLAFRRLTESFDS